MIKKCNWRAHLSGVPAVPAIRLGAPYSHHPQLTTSRHVGAAVPRPSLTHAHSRGGPWGVRAGAAGTLSDQYIYEI